MVTDRENAFYQRLRIEVVKAAVFDLQKALRKSDRLGFVCDEQIALEQWFLSKWGQLMSGDNGELIIEKCKKTYKKDPYPNRRKRLTEKEKKQIYADYKNGVRYKFIIQHYDINPAMLYEIVRRFDNET